MKRDERKSRVFRNDEKASSVQISKASISVSRAKSTVSVDYRGRQSVAFRSSGKTGFKVPKYQNSYWLDPFMPFRYEVSDKILKELMIESLKDKQYSEDTVDLCRNLAMNILDRLYKNDFDRVKYVVIINIIENTGQSINSASGRLWDADRDKYSVFVYDQPTFFATGLIFAMNYE